jgi:predicted enzyme related to lactoylglutathione lyase
VIYAHDVDALAGFYERLGFREGFRMALAGVKPGPGPRHELFAYVVDVDATVAGLREAGTTIVREPVDMFWGERLAYVADPEGNLVVLAGASAT